VLAAIYPFTKRFLAMPQAWLGACFGLGIPMAFAAVRGEVPALAWALWGANLFWVLAYDTVYAMVDRDDDQAIGIHTSALLFGRHDLAAVYLCHAAFVGALAAIGIWQGHGVAYYAGVACAAALALRDLPLVRSRSREACFRAFRRAHGMGAAVFLGIVADALLRP
jgi:4-hydroxybenzoate polyprenyltransferase